MALVLLVEDDPRVAQLCVRLLERMGLDVHVASTGAQAIEFLTADPRPLSLAYVDVGLPDASGLDVAAQAHRLRPSLPVLVATGSLGDVDAGGSIVLRKPFTLDQFRDAVLTALASAGSPGGAAAPTDQDVAHGLG